VVPRRVLVDCDPATGVRNRDVDDGLAILMLLAAPHVVVEGITVCFGNVKADVGFSVARDLLQRVGATVPLIKGAQRREDIGTSNPAVDYLIDAVRQSPGELTLLTLAPLTNVATAMSLDPTFAPNIKELVVMGGSLAFKPFAWFGELNFRWDARAAASVVAAQIPKSLITMDVCAGAVFRQQQLDMLKDRDSDMADYLVAALEPWLNLNRKFFFRAQGFFPWDVVAAAYVIDRSLFGGDSGGGHPMTLSVQHTGLRSGRLLNDATDTGSSSPTSTNRQDRGPRFPVQVPLELDRERFMTLFMAALLHYC
ncbi:MAG: nucleoside hydrolase, partial [Actinomycetes bacterium]